MRFLYRYLKLQFLYPGSMPLAMETRKSLQDLISHLQREQKRLGDQLAALQEAVKVLDDDTGGSPQMTGPQPQSDRRPE
jgi:hypothetical protein